MKTPPSPEPRPLSARQRECLLAVAAGVLKGRPPSVRDLGAILGDVRPMAVQSLLEQLERKGWVVRDAPDDLARSAVGVTLARSLRLTGMRLRLYGTRPCYDFLDTPAGWALAQEIGGVAGLTECEPCRCD